MDERMELRLRVGLADHLDPIAGEHPRWASSPAAARVAALDGRARSRWQAFALVAATVCALTVAGAFALFAAGVIPPVTPPVVPPPSASPVASPSIEPSAAPSAGPPQGDTLTLDIGADIADIAFAPDGSAWLATSRGVAHWEWAAGRVTLYGQGDGLPATSAVRVTVAPDGSAWASGTGWVARFAGRRWTAFTDFGIATAPDLGGIAVGPDGTFWVAANTVEGDAKLLRYDGAWSAIDGPPNTGTSFPWTGSLGVAPDGTVWVGTGGPSGGASGVYAYDGHAWRTSATSAELGGQPSLAGIEPGGAVWVSMEATCLSETGPCPDPGNGVARFDGTRWTPYTTADGLATSNVRLVVSADGSARNTAWATYGEGHAGPGKISRFDGTRWTTFDVPEAAGARAIAVAPYGALWLTTAAGLARFDGTTFDRLAVPDASVTTGVPSLSLRASDVPVTTTSPSGTVSWRTYNVPAGHWLLPVVATSHGFVSIDDPDLRWSIDGVTWEGTGLSIGPWRLAVDGDDVIAYGQGGAVRLAWDGSRWAETERMEITGAPGFSAEQVVYGPRRAVMTGGETVVYSADGNSFAPAAQGPDKARLPASAGASGCGTVVASGTGEGSIGQVLATPDGFVALTPRRAAGWTDWPWCEPLLWSSADGSRWDLRSPESPFGAGAWVAKVAASGGRYVAVGGIGEAGAIWVSDDALTWTHLPLVLGKGFSIGVGAPGWFVAAIEGNGLQAWHSTDALTWTRLPDMTIPDGYVLPDLAVGSRTVVMSNGTNVTILTLER